MILSDYVQECPRTLFEVKWTLELDSPLDTIFQNGFLKHDLSSELHFFVQTISDYLHNDVT